MDFGGGYGGFDGCCPSYGYSYPQTGCGYALPVNNCCGGGGIGTSFTIIVVLFILLIIIGASFC